MSTPVTFGRPLARTPPRFARVAIVGVGLIGGSLAMAIRTRWPEVLVIGVDRKSVIQQAIVAGAIDVGGEDLGLAGDADLIVLAAPVSVNERLLSQELIALVQREAVVTDVGSVKRGIVQVAANLPERLAFVGGHPIAGAASGGLEHARPDLFVGRPWILCPAEGALHGVDEFVQGLGAASRLMSPTAHDRVMSFLSALPQLTASALMSVVGPALGPEDLALSGRGLQDTTRLASSPPGIWKDIAASNADHIGPALDLMISVLQELRAGLTTGEALDRVFALAQEWKSQMPS